MDIMYRHPAGVSGKGNNRPSGSNRAGSKKSGEGILEEAQDGAGADYGCRMFISEIAAHRIGSYSSREIGRRYMALMKGWSQGDLPCRTVLRTFKTRALILEKEAAEQYGYEMVNVVPALKAGGSFATAAYAG